MEGLGAQGWSGPAHTRPPAFCKNINGSRDLFLPDQQSTTRQPAVNWIGI